MLDGSFQPVRYYLLLSVPFLIAGATSAGLTMKILQSSAAYATGSSLILFITPPTSGSGRSLFSPSSGLSNKGNSGVAGSSPLPPSLLTPPSPSLPPHTPPFPSLPPHSPADQPVFQPAEWQVPLSGRAITKLPAPVCSDQGSLHQVHGLVYQTAPPSLRLPPPLPSPSLSAACYDSRNHCVWTSNNDWLDIWDCSGKVRVAAHHLASRLGKASVEQLIPPVQSEQER